MDVKEVKSILKKETYGRGIGHEIYPARALGYIMLCVELFMKMRLDPDDTHWAYMLWIGFFFFYPHVIFQVYRYFNSRNSLERTFLVMDMFWIGAASFVLDFTIMPTSALVVYGSASCIGIGGLPMWGRAMGLFALSQLVMWFAWGSFEFTTEPTLWSNINGFIFMFFGFNAYNFAYYRRSITFKKIRMESDRQRIKIEEQKAIIEDKNENTINSIAYSQNIQKAFFPEKGEIKSNFRDAFIFLKPMDIVSGDFYWFYQTEEKCVLAAVDCTGHGVPGAFMSIIANELLNQIIIENQIIEPDEILNALHKKIRITLKQSEGSNRDGLDMALICLDKKTNVISCSGAKNPIIIIQNGELILIKGDKMTIGGEQREMERVFTKHQIKINSSDDNPTTLYMFSDGYQDQFGGTKNKKFQSARFRDLLFNIHQKTCDEQELILEKTIDEWIGPMGQIDDILVVGVKI